LTFNNGPKRIVRGDRAVCDRAEEGKDFDHGIPEKFLGYWRDPRWRDMSDFVVHFTTTSTGF